MSVSRVWKHRPGTYAYKRDLDSLGKLECEVCGWRLVGARGDFYGLEAHHIRPLSHGGQDEADNLVVLCPNHHAMAHHLWPKKRGVGGLVLPIDRGELIRVVRQFESDPLTFRKANLFKVASLLHASRT
jgi:5-methylcytosine-specific restriction endonuclease McrA